MLLRALQTKKLLIEEANQKVLQSDHIDTALDLMNKAMKNLASAVRNLESAMQYADETNDDNLLRSLEDMRKSLLHKDGTGVGWEGNIEHDNTMTQLSDLIDEYSEDYGNFNLSGTHDTVAPIGDSID